SGPWAARRELGAGGLVLLPGFTGATGTTSPLASVPAEAISARRLTCTRSMSATDSVTSPAATTPAPRSRSTRSTSVTSWAAARRLERRALLPRLFVVRLEPAAGHVVVHPRLDSPLGRAPELVEPFGQRLLGPGQRLPELHFRPEHRSEAERRDRAGREHVL